MKPEHEKWWKVFDDMEAQYERDYWAARAGGAVTPSEDAIARYADQQGDEAAAAHREWWRQKVQDVVELMTEESRSFDSLTDAQIERWSVGVVWEVREEISQERLAREGTSGTALAE